METVALVVVCTIVFGVVTALSLFIRQLLLSRDKHLNDLAQERAVLQESNGLEKLRTQMESNKRFDSHYQVLGANKDAICYIDQKIQVILDKKSALIQRYAQMALTESSTIIGNGASTDRKALCDLLRYEIDREMEFYNLELQQLQARRGSLWDSNLGLQDNLIADEESRNRSLDKLYEGHSGLLEKIYMRHDKSSEDFAEQTLKAGTQSFKETVMAPIKFLAQYFKLSSNISPEKMEDEKNARKKVKDAENVINDISNDKKADSSDKELVGELAHFSP